MGVGWARRGLDLGQIAGLSPMSTHTLVNHLGAMLGLAARATPDEMLGRPGMSIGLRVICVAGEEGP